MLYLNNLDTNINLPTKMEKKASLKRLFFRTDEDKKTTNSAPKSQKKRLTNFE